ncbi:AAA family ATPase [Hymenobacter glaciei]|uniref:AAA family ATPase n=1 Tax=Hymenobacter glaciei TaxID=877209 RepID=A0ABP7UBW4_9BACT
MPTRAQLPAVPRLTYLRIKNYRALRDVEFRDLTPLTVLIGPNGSGKSTVLDALDFLADAMALDLKSAWGKRNRFAGIRTRGIEGPISFEIVVAANEKHLRYTIEISEGTQKEPSKVFISYEKFEVLVPNPCVVFECMYKGDEREHAGVQVPYLLPNGRSGTVVGEEDFGIVGNSLRGPLDLGSSNDAQLKTLAHAVWALTDTYRYIHLTDEHLKGHSDEGPREELSPNGNNLPNVLYYLHTKHPETLEKITAQMRRWVPGLADIVTEITSDERLLLRFRDAPFEKPLPAQYMSAGTMRLAALLTLLYEPGATGLLGIEEPENELHPRLLPRLAEELGKATETRQLLVATHSPLLLDALEPEQVWILDRGPDGYTQATRTADIPHVKQMVEDGSPLGYLWTSNFFSVGDPLAPRKAASDAR